MNKPLANFSASSDATSISTGGYRPDVLASNGSSPELLVLLAFSGGGARAAAFSYGVLRGLRDFRITIAGRERRLLDQLDMIAAVSGGSFPAAYYGLYRDKIFDDFERDYLKRDITNYFLGNNLLPWKWQIRFLPPDGTLAWWMNPVTRNESSEAMAEVYDELIFHGATYSDLIRKGKPFVLINTTDITHGTIFAFSQDMFDPICSDLSTFSIALAVSASSAYPPIFTPITLENHAQACAGRNPAWLRPDGKAALPRERYLNAYGSLYRDASKAKFLHLMDGGLADNLGLRYLIGTVLNYGDNHDALRRAGRDHLRRIVLLSVDAGTSPIGAGGSYAYRIDPRWQQERFIPPNDALLSALFGTEITNYNSGTIAFVNKKLDETVKELRRLRCEESSLIDGYSCGDVQGYFVHLALSDAPDPQMREQLQQIPTALTVPDEAVDRLVATGETLVRNSTILAEMRRSLEALP